ncbi:lytic murein transglycosylase B [Aestuariirhabdus litorea]|uniref:Lytic murein transglycosylase B n=1 Tax=Aestuariirhabdus litorea TaxID=2528527 RepID=A0A3P3VNR8_9GAMM|nr:lytic murein transglycosylase B [Aestuariirhabdus litorea]RRJ83568.1 lytic murein transglycosylase B [Aestuariirhabdus litorea]RWW96789.1 lytic murein transglycosylase B [Endozoicomonadaceae bacterium GTF-13]
MRRLPVLGISLCLAAGGALAADYSGSPQALALIEEMVEEHQYDRETLQRVFDSAERKQPILDAIARPAERTKTWGEYRKIFLTPARTEAGLAFWQQHAEALSRAEREYGVPAQIIVAIIGVETFYGKHKGRFRVVDALSTLGFDYEPRQSFFRKQLKEFLLLSREQRFDPLELTGSYAGAMGFPQFIPSSFRAYAVDFDGDGQIDIWNNPVDAIGSVANYFRRHGWQQGAPVVTRARVSGSRYADGVSDKLKPAQTLEQLEALGWEPLQAPAADASVRGIRLQGERGSEFWVGMHNFYVITRYNHSTLYAMAAYQLSEELKDAQAKAL